jgi:hyperosmotically inducible protein
MSARVVMFLLAFGLAANTGVSGAAQKDPQISDDVWAAVSRYGQFTIFDDVSAIVRDGFATLTGKVTMGYKRDEIEKRVARVDGVRGVRNLIAVLPASTFDDELRQKIARAIYGNASFWNYAAMPNPPIHIIVEHSHVTLTGVVRSEVDRALARALATQPGALSVTNNLKTSAEVLDALEKSQ